MTNQQDPIDLIIDVASGVADAEPNDVENRNTRRCDYGEDVAFVQWTPTGGKSIATIVTCKNISSTGVCVVSRYMLHVGHEGVILLEKSNGKEVMLGVRVVHCSYVGDMKHESGLTFTELPEAFSLEDFRDEQGHMPRIGRRAA